MPYTVIEPEAQPPQSGKGFTVLQPEKGNFTVLEPENGSIQNLNPTLKYLADPRTGFAHIPVEMAEGANRLAAGAFRTLVNGPSAIKAVIQGNQNWQPPMQPGQPLISKEKVQDLLFGVPTDESGVERVGGKIYPHPANLPPTVQNVQKFGQGFSSGAENLSSQENAALAIGTLGTGVLDKAMAETANRILTSYFFSSVAPEVYQKAFEFGRNPSFEKAGELAIDLPVAGGLLKEGTKPISMPDTRTGIKPAEVRQGSPDFPFVPQRNARFLMPDADQTGYKGAPPLIGQHEITLMPAPVLPQFEARPATEPIQPAVGFSGEPKQGGQISFEGQGVPSAMQAKEMVPKPSLKFKTGVDPDDLRPAVEIGGRLLVGNRGDAHADVLEANGIPASQVDHFDKRRGFAIAPEAAGKYPEHAGKLIDRSKASELTGIRGNADAGGLDSQQLPDAAMVRAMRMGGFSDKEISETIAERRQAQKPKQELMPTGTSLGVKPISKMVTSELAKELGAKGGTVSKDDLGKAYDYWESVKAAKEQRDAQLKKELIESHPDRGGSQEAASAVGEKMRRADEVFDEIRRRMAKFGVNTGEGKSVQDFLTKTIGKMGEQPRKAISDLKVIDENNVEATLKDYDQGQGKTFLDQFNGILGREGYKVEVTDADRVQRVYKVKVTKKEGGTGGRLYSGLPFLDPEFKKTREREKELRGPFVSSTVRFLMSPEQSGFKRDVEYDSTQLWNRIVNKVPQEGKMLDQMGIGAQVKAKGKLTPDEAARIVQESAPRVEVRRFGSGKDSEAGREAARLQHELDTKFPGWSDITIENELKNQPERLTDFRRLREQLDIQETKKGSSAEGEANWQSIAPKPESDMPGYVEGAVVVPLDREVGGYKVVEMAPGKFTVADKEGRLIDKNQYYSSVEDAQRMMSDFGGELAKFPSSHSFPPNTLGFFRGYMETRPDGGKTFHVIEVQSDWAQARRKVEDRIKEALADEPMATEQGLIRVLQNAREFTQNHPLLKDWERLTLKAAIDHAKKEGADRVAIQDAESAMLMEGHDRAARDYQVGEGEPGSRELKVPQEKGMRLHYDQTLPKILKELTESEGQRVEFGEHKMAMADQWRDETPGDLRKAFREDLIFRNPDGTPKTTVSAREFPLDKTTKAAFSVTEKDRPASLTSTKFYGGIPIFDPELWGQSKEAVDKLRIKFASRLEQQGDKTGAETMRNASPKQYIPKTEREKAILDNAKASPLSTRDQIVNQPGEKPTLGDSLRNKVSAALNVASKADKYLLPRDVIYDMLDGTGGKYNGPLTENIRGPLEDDFNAALNMEQLEAKPVEDLIKKNKIGPRESERIDVYLKSIQEGGKQRMLDSGVSSQAIANALKLTPKEMEVATALRAFYDKSLPAIQKVAKQADKVDLKVVQNYSPWHREWRKYKPLDDEIATNPKLKNKSGATVDDVLWPGLEQTDNVRVKPSSLESRKKGAKTPIKLDAVETFQRYKTDFAHYVAMRSHLKEFAAIVGTDAFRKKYGDLGQKLIMEDLNVIARQGRYARNPFLDTLRRLTSRGVIAFRLPSQFVHMANIPLAQERVGVMSWNEGLRQAMTKEGQEFLRKNFAETFARGGGEEAITEIVKAKAKTPIGKGYNEISRAGFFIQRSIDRLNAQATVLAHYMNELEKQGKNRMDYAELPVDQGAVRRARIIARRAVASPLYKDVPLALTRSSAIKSLMQFQVTFLDQWSNIRYDLLQNRVPEIFRGNPKEAFTMTMAIAAMLLVESSVKYSYKQGLNTISGQKQKEDDTFSHEVSKEALRRIPGVGQASSAFVYGETGVPSLDVAIGAVKSGVKAVNATSESQRALAGTRAAAAIGETLGVPGTSQAADIATRLEERKFFKPHEKRLQEQEGKAVDKMNLAERLVAEHKYKKEQPKRSREEETRIAERAIENEAKRGKAVQEKLDKADQQWLESRKLNLPGYQQFIKAGKDNIYMTEKEQEKFQGLVEANYKKVMPILRKVYDSLPAEGQARLFTTATREAKKLAELQMVKEMSNSKNETNRFSILK